MDYLNVALKNLTAKEIYLLKNRIRHQNKKIRLFEIIQKEGDLSNKELSKAISYGPKLTNLYALKNRLLNDLITVKLDLNRTEVIETREMVQNIRSLVYSRDKNILIRQLKMLQKKCEALELYAELREVYFCFQLLSRHDQRKMKMYRDLMQDADQKQQCLNRLEEIFYFHILTTQDLFFYPHKEAYKKGVEFFRELELIHEKLRSQSSLFLYLSAELTLNLNQFFDPDRKEEYRDKLILLSQTYQNAVVADKYPNCSVAIECLYSRFYFLTKEEDQFEKVQKSIGNQGKEVQGYQMFDSSFLYFMYMEILKYVQDKQSEELVSFIEDNLDEDSEPSDMTTRIAFEYLRALKEFYRGNHYRSSSILLKSRIHLSWIDLLSSWSVIENILLTILNGVLSGDTSTLKSEASLLRRVFKKFRHDKVTIKVLDSYVKDLVKIGINDEQIIAKVTAVLGHIQSDTGFMKMVDISMYSAAKTGNY